MFRLTLFGGATIEGPEGLLFGRVAQRRQLALLAYLSLQGARPTSRDKLLALLWPELDTERARHALADAVYLVRKALGEGSILSLGDDLVLSGERVTSDAGDFGARLDAADPEGAVALYAGPFLEGFHLPDSREYEQWLEGERERLARAHLGALEALAVRAEASGDRNRAVEWWRKAAAAEPYNTRVAVGLMRALAASGDRAGAVRWAKVHETLLLAEFGIEPDPALQALVRELRQRVGAEPEADGPGVRPGVKVAQRAGAEPEAGAPEDPSAVDGAPSGQATSATPAAGGEAREPSSRRLRPRARTVVGVSAALGLFAAVAGFWLVGARSPADAGFDFAALDPDVVVVPPFRTAGASPELEYLGQGMVELLAAKLSADAVLAAVDPGLVLARWRAVQAEGAGVGSAAEALALARALGAGAVIVGGVVGTPAALSLHAAVLDARTGTVSAEATVQGSEEELHELVDRLAGQILARRAGEEEHRLAHLTSASPPALRTFLHARAAHRRGDYEVAIREYGRALDLDSTFALAGMGISQLAGWVGGSAPLAARAYAVTTRHAERLSERDRAGLLGRVAPRDPRHAPSLVESLEAVEEALRRWPDHPLLWYRRGDHLLHYGRSLGLPSWERRARESFERAIELDQDYAEPVHHLAIVLAITGDSVALRALAEEQLSRRASGPVADHLRWRTWHGLGRDAAFLPGPLEAMETDATLRWIGIEAQDYGFAFSEGLRAVQLRLDRPGIRDEHFERRIGAFSWALNRGRPAEALRILESVREVQPDPWFHARIAVLTALYADGDEAAAERGGRELAGVVTEDALGEVNQCVLGQWRIARSGGREAEAVREALPSEARRRIDGPLASYREICSAVLGAQYAARFGSGPGSAETAHLEALLAIGRHWSLVDDGHTEFAHVALARLHEAAGDYEAALRALRRRAYYNGWQPYLATLLGEEGRLAARLGDTAGAVRAWEHYLTFRADPEASLLDGVERIRGELGRVRAARGRAAGGG
jgi:DNA-binding SARP family transcriptional activator